MTEQDRDRSLRWIIAAVATAHLVIAFLLPITQDEAYYFHWAKFLDWGYFDHPPFIAWLLWPGTWFDSISIGRLLPVLLVTAAVPLVSQMVKRMGFSANRVRDAALLLFFFSLFGAAFGVIATPDVPMLFFWIVAVHEAQAALLINPKRWLTAGIAAGLGMLGKYTMVLIGPVFLIAMWRAKQLRSPWPYLGALLATLVFGINLAWNYQESWISYKFQFGRGLKSAYDVAGDFHSPLPRLDDKIYDAQGYKLSEYFLRKEKPKKKKPLKGPLQLALKRQSEYWGGQLGAFGLFLIPMVLSGRRRKEGLPRFDPQGKALILAAGGFPLLFFGLIAWVQKIEANWPAAYILGASLFCAPWVSGHLKMMRWIAILHVTVITGFALLVHLPFDTGKSDENRLLQEVHGFDRLADFLAKDSLPLFAENYQLGSLLSYYQPERMVAQWPGLARNSEMTRRAEMTSWTMQDLKSIGRFKLVTTQISPPEIEGFSVIDLTEVRDCMEGIEVVVASLKDDYDPQCKDPIHRWFVSTFKLANGNS